MRERANAPPANAPPASEEELEAALSRPPEALVRALACIDGAIMVLGAGGKMGPSLTAMAKRADPSRRVIAVSRWSDRAAQQRLSAHGVETLSADLLDPAQLAALPDAPNVVFMAGQKFGTSASPASTWAMNAAVPSFAAERFAGARTAVFSTGNVYALTTPASGGATEHDAPAPIGEYAYSCLARERIFAHSCMRHGTRVSIVRLNYAHDLRYGVLTDIARKIAAGEPVDLAMGHVNVIWQGDANALALASLRRASAPEPWIVNVAGPQVLSVQTIARALGERLGMQPVFAGEPAGDALLSSALRMQELLIGPLMPVETLLEWVAAWIRQGGRLLSRPTSFERRDGKF